MTTFNHLNLATLANVTRGRLRCGDGGERDAHNQLLAHIVTDSRFVLPGDVFWALRGRRHDGARFVPQAFEQGAAGVVTQTADIHAPPCRWSLEVDDTLAALWRLAAWKRCAFRGPVVAITGSVAKSTTRSMLHGILRQSHGGITSPRSFNNHVGLPLSMLELGPHADYALFELGASRPGEINQLAGLCRPQVGVITSAGDAHLGTFGGYQAIARAKCELLEHLPSGGPAILNADCPRLRRAAADWNGRAVWFGQSPDADVSIGNVSYADGRLGFRIGTDRFYLPVWGRHHLVPAVAAVAAARVLGATTREIQRGLAEFEPLPNRSNVCRLGEFTLIDDTYNASPSAVAAALELLRETTTAGRRIAVLGDMCELGAAAATLHRLVGELAATRARCDLVIACGEYANQVAQGAQGAGMRADRVHACGSVEETWQTLRAAIQPDDAVLLKGSRAVGLERVVAALQQLMRDDARSTSTFDEYRYRNIGAPSLVPGLRELGTAHPPG